MPAGSAAGGPENRCCSAHSRYTAAVPASNPLVRNSLVGKLATKYSDQWMYSPLLVKLSSKYVYPLATRLMGDLVFLDWAYEEDPPIALPLRRPMSQPIPHQPLPPHGDSGGYQR